MNGIRYWIATLITVVIFSSLVDRSEAENGEVLTLDEVVVTAGRHQRSLMQVPLSITALSDEELDASAIENTFDDVVAINPNDPAADPDHCLQFVKMVMRGTLCA